jgi:hypothetical protein
MVKHQQLRITEIIMSNEVKRAWEARRNKAIERLIAAWEQYDGESNTDCEGISTAADAVAVAHIAAALEWEREPRGRWKDQEEKAMDRLVAAWEKFSPTEEDPETEEELNIALDALAVSHTAATFEFASGPLKW